MEGHAFSFARRKLVYLHKIASSKMDKWEFYKDVSNDWRWRRTAPNGNIVGAASQGYSNRSDCLANAQRNGYTGG